MQTEEPPLYTIQRRTTRDPVAWFGILVRAASMALLWSALPLFVFTFLFGDLSPWVSLFALSLFAVAFAGALRQQLIGGFWRIKLFAARLQIEWRPLAGEPRIAEFDFGRLRHVELSRPDKFAITCADAAGNACHALVVVIDRHQLEDAFDQITTHLDHANPPPLLSSCEGGPIQYSRPWTFDELLPDQIPCTQALLDHETDRVIVRGAAGEHHTYAVVRNHGVPDKPGKRRNPGAVALFAHPRSSRNVDPVLRIVGGRSIFRGGMVVATVESTADTLEVHPGDSATGSLRVSGGDIHLDDDKIGCLQRVEAGIRLDLESPIPEILAAVVVGMGTGVRS